MAQNHTSIILDSIADGVFTIDLDWKITSFNSAAERITGINRDEAFGRHCWEVFRANVCEKQCVLKKTIETGKRISNKSIYIVNSKGNRTPVSISTAILRDKEGRIIGGVETFRDLSLVEELRKELTGKHTFFDIVSKNKEMHRLFGLLEQVARSDSNVLLQGESGTGKELFAKAIHSLSARGKGPLVTVNLGALPDSLIESELFGHKAGAFTGARLDRTGRIAAAEKGTLFLDEVADLSLNLQVRLLRVLQERTYEPLGSNMTIKADVRFVAATNKDLGELVKKGSFREDLYYRINVIKLVLPPLRERQEDVPLLIDHFLRKFNHMGGKNITAVSQDVLALLAMYNYPGNIRELENIIEHATVLCREEVIKTKHLPDYLQRHDSFTREGDKGTGSLKGVKWNDLEKRFLLQALKNNNWSKKATALELGIGRQTLWRKIKRLNIKLPGKDGRSLKTEK